MRTHRLALAALAATLALVAAGSTSSLARSSAETSAAGSSVFERIAQIDAGTYIVDPKCMRECPRKNRGATQEECRAMCQMGREEKAPPPEIGDSVCIRHCERQGRPRSECEKDCKF